MAFGDDDDAEGSKAFSILHNKGLAVDLVALCPKMDLIAILTADGSLVVLRTISWQKLHSVPAADLQDNRVTALAWSPDGNVVALGHTRGSISLVDVERGESPEQPFGCDRLEVGEQSPVMVLLWVTQYRDPSSLSSLDIEKERSSEVARYYMDRDEVFLEDLPVLGQQGGSFAAAREKKEEPIGAKLTAGHALDILVTCFSNGGVLLLASGLFPLVSFRLQELIPGPTAALAIQSAAVTSDLASLMLAVEVGEGGKDGSTLVALSVPFLWENRHQLKPITSEFSRMSSLMSHLQEALDLAERHWKDGLRTLEIKLELFNSLLRDYACQASAREALLSLVLSGVACPALAQYLSQNCSEPQQHNMFRLSKTVDDKCANVEGLLREQVGRVAEMLVFHASKLRGMARMGAEFQDVGLCPNALSALLEAAVRLSLKAEEALREVQQARQNLKVFLLWLLDTMQHQPTGGTSNPGLTFRNSTKHIRMLLSFLRKPPAPGKATNTEAIIAVQVSAYFKDEPLPVPFPSSSTPSLGAISLRTQAKELRTRFEAVFAGPLQTLKSRPPPCRFVRLTSSHLPAAPSIYPQWNGPVIVALAQSDCAVVLSIDINEQQWAGTGPFFPFQAIRLEPPSSRILQRVALYGRVPTIPSSNDDALVFLARGGGAAAAGPSNPSSTRPSAELWKIPLESLEFSTIPIELFASAPCLMDTLGQTAASSIPSIEGTKGRELVQAAAEDLKLNVTGSRGVAAVSSRANHLMLIDMEEDDDIINDDDDDDDEIGGGRGSMDVDDEEKA